MKPDAKSTLSMLAVATDATLVKIPKAMQSPMDVAIFPLWKRPARFVCGAEQQYLLDKHMYVVGRIKVGQPMGVPASRMLVRNVVNFRFTTNNGVPRPILHDHHTKGSGVIHTWASCSEKLLRAHPMHPNQELDARAIRVYPPIRLFFSDALHVDTCHDVTERAQQQGFVMCTQTTNVGFQQRTSFNIITPRYYATANTSPYFLWPSTLLSPHEELCLKRRVQGDGYAWHDDVVLSCSEAITPSQAAMAREAGHAIISRGATSHAVWPLLYSPVSIVTPHQAKKGPGVVPRLDARPVARVLEF